MPPAWRDYRRRLSNQDGWIRAQAVPLEVYFPILGAAHQPIDSDMKKDIIERLWSLAASRIYDSHHRSHRNWQAQNWRIK